MASRSLESLFELRRGKLSLQEYAVEFDARMEEAHERAGLEMNEVAHFYFFFKNSGLAPRLVEDIKLQVHGDLRRYQEARSLALRMSSKNDIENYYQDDASAPSSDQDFWGSSWWTDDTWEEGYDEVLYDASSWYGDEEYYDEEAEAWPDEDGDEPADGGDDEDWSYPVKGNKGKRSKGNAMGVGCSVCGSKWHHAASCPVSGKGGKGSGLKGSEKGFGSKGGSGKGFRRPWSSKGKGKGYGKWRPWSSKGFKGKSKGKWRGYAEYPDEFNYEKNLAAHFGTDTFAAFPSRSSSQPEVFRMDKEEQEFLGKRAVPSYEEPGRKTKVTFEEPADDAEEQSQSTGAANNQSSKNLAFNFPVTLYADREHFHMIEGHKRRGLLVDPGASNGLIGSETLRDILDTCMPEKERNKIQWSNKVASVSGISGAKDKTLGEVTIPIGFGDKDKGTFTADVLGGEGSLCPALLSNPALRKMSSVIYSNFFDNGDGLLACHPRGGEPQGKESSWSHFRLLLTDSGHYLLPVDKESNLVSEEAKSKATTFLQSSVAMARKHWSDVRHCFFGTGNAELERSEVYHEVRNFSKEPKHSVHRDPTDVPEHSVPRDPADVPEHSVPRDPADVPEHSVPRDPADVPEHSVPDSSAGVDAPGEQVTSPSSTRHISVRGLFLLTSDDPRVTWKKEDTWTLFGDVLVRHHHKHRRSLFTPSCTKDCPVSPHLLSDRRETTWHCGGVTKVLKDSWTKSAHPHRDLGQMWTGQTKLYLRAEATTPKASTETTQDAAELPWKSSTKYQNDRFPEHWTPAERKRHEQRYDHMPEEYYTKTKRRPVTPKNFSSWFSRSRGRGLRWQFQELFSGTGRLSLLAVMSGLVVGFPVDYRYGWDLSLHEHQEMVRQARGEFLPYYLYASPTSSPWSQSSSKVRHLRQAERIHEKPSLVFLRDLCHEQAKQDLRFGIEQPLNSAMFQDKASPLNDVYDIPGVRRKQQVDQCFHGCVNSEGLPIKKATTILSNVKHYKAAKRCSGHRGLGHVVQSNPALGTNFVSSSFTYPRRMCHALVEDIWKSLKTSGVQVNQWPSELLLHSNFSGYKCERCQLGRAALPWMEHTLIPGECRHGRRPPGEGKQPLRPPDPLSLFKRKAREKDMEGIVLETPADIFLPVQDSLYLKYTLMMMVQDSVALFTEAVERHLDYVHWITDPVQKTMFQEIFQKEMNVKGVACALRPFHCITPEPQLSSKAAPLRLQIRGNVKKWTVMEVEDFRLLSHSQQHQPIDEIDWLVTLFGSDPGSPEPAAKEGADDPPGAIPSTPTKAGHRARASSSKDTLPAPASKDKVPDEPEEVEDIEETFEGAPQQDIKPLYSFKKVFKRLVQIAETDPLTAKRLILGLHERFYHAPMGDLRNLLARCGMPGPVLNLVPDAIKSCAVCRKFVRLPNRPQVKINTSNVFNERVQMDLFQYSGK
eukprot:s1731_g5.t1